MKKLRLLPLLVAFATFALPSLSKAQSYPPVFSSTATYVAGDLVQYGGNWYRAAKALAAHGPYPSNGYGSWELNYVRSNTTLVIGVGQQFPSLQDAWAFALEARVADGAYLHFSISTAKGTLQDTFSGGFSLDHQSGSKISIIGDNASDIFLGGPNGFYNTGLYIDSGHTIASISNVSIIGQGALGQGAGLSATGCATLNCTGIAIGNFEFGVQASKGASITLDNTTAITLSQDYSVDVSQNATVFCQGINITDSFGDSILHATSGGMIEASGCTLDGSHGNIIIGVDADEEGDIDVDAGTISNCSFGVRAYDHSYVNAAESHLSGNMTDLVAEENGVVNDDGVNNPSVSIDSGVGSVID